MKTLIVSAVGTSILTNNASEEMRRVLIDTANLRRDEIPKDKLSKLEEWAETVENTMQEASQDEWKHKSAEINGILSYLSHGETAEHVLIVTDTWQGHKCATIVERFVRGRLMHKVSSEQLKGLSTKTTADFRSAMSEFVMWCDKTLPGYQQQRYRIVFNATGGFKALQAYLTVLGMFYADEIIYIFEGPTGDLIRIPRLPVKLNAQDICKRNAVWLEMLWEKEQMPSDMLRLQEDVGLLTEEVSIEGKHWTALSEWGHLIWGQCRKEILAGELLEWPLLTYSPTFKKDYENIRQPEFKAAVQEALARVARLLLLNSGDLKALKSDRSLQYKEYKDREGIAHFRVDKGNRVSCEKNNGGLLLRRVGTHDDVNRNP